MQNEHLIRIFLCNKDKDMQGNPNRVEEYKICYVKKSIKDSVRKGNILSNNLIFITSCNMEARNENRRSCTLIRKCIQI